MVPQPLELHQELGHERVVPDETLCNRLVEPSLLFPLPPSQNIFLTSVCLQMLLTILFVVVVGTLPSLNCWRILL